MPTPPTAVSPSRSSRNAPRPRRGLNRFCRRIGFAKRAGASPLEQLLGASSRIYGYQDTAPAGMKASSIICTGAPQPLVWHGPVAAFCG